MRAVPFSTDYLGSLEPDGKSLRVFDPDFPGLAAFLSHDGSTRVFFAYRWEEGMDEPIEVEIGSVTALSVEQARHRASEIVGLLSTGREFPAIRQSMGTARLLAIYGEPLPPSQHGSNVRKPGECAKCGDMTLIDQRSLCDKCRPLPPCLNHPDTLSEARCRSCNRPFCDVCMTNRLCDGCAAKPGKKKGRAGIAAPAFAVKLMKPGFTADRKRFLAVLVGVFVFIQVGMYALQNFNTGPAATPEEYYEQRIGIALGGIEAYKQIKNSLPPDAGSLAAFLKAQGSPPLTLVAQTSPLPKDAVVYVKKGEAYELYATTNEGERYNSASTNTPAPANK